MKKLYFLLLLSLLGSSRLYAQVTDSMRLKLDYLFANLDKSQVPTGFLDAYATPLIPLTSFNGIMADSTRTTPSVFRALYATAYSSRIYGTNSLQTLSNFNTSVKSAETALGSATIPLMAMRFDYATVRQEAFSQNLLVLQSQRVYDVAGRSASPYVTQTMFAVAPARTFSPTGDVALQLQRSLFTEVNASTGFTLAETEINFGDGYFVRAVWDQPIRFTYTTSGTKRIQVRFTYRKPPVVIGGRVNPGASIYYESQFDLFVAAPARALSRTTTADPYIDFGPLPGQAAGKAYIHYGTDHTTGVTHTSLVKPFIVAEGFDRSFIAPHIPPGNYSIGEFLTDIQTTPGFNFGNALENVGDYDIVFIDYANGTDDIRLNAGLFKAVVDWVNTNKDRTANQQNVVMGMSMGGLIARYKLAEMEQTAPGSTQTRLLILQDSPQRGANIPLGLSALLRQSLFSLGSYTTGTVDLALQEANALLDQPATKQMLLYQTTTDVSGSIFFAGNTFIEGEYRTKVNYQAPYKIVAVSQGSQCGTGLFAPYTELIRGTGHLNLFNYPFIFAGSSGVFGEVIVNAIPPNGQSNRVSGLNAVEQTSLFFGLYKIKVQLIRQNYVCPPGLLPLDGAAGGTEPIGAAVGLSSGITGGNAQKGPFWLPFVAFYKLADNFCFIPTPSGLDIADFNTTTIAGRYVNSVASSSTSRTNGFLAQEQFSQGSGTKFNQPHLTFTARNSEWIFNEMQRPFKASPYFNTVGCTTECTPTTIASSLAPGQRMCVGTSATFSIPGLAAGAPVSWSATPASNFTVSTGSGPTFTTTASSTAIGNSTITALVGDCQTSVSITVPTGPGEPKGYYTGGSNGSGTLTTYQTFATSNTQGIDIGMFLNDPYNFTFTSDLPGLYLTNTSGTATHFILKPGQGVTITATATNAPCGLVGRFAFICTKSGYRYAATPNPTSDELTVTFMDSNTNEGMEKSAGFDADLYDTYGKKIKTQHGDHGKAVFDVRQLPDGLYNLRIGQGKDAYSEHIQLKH
jgi:hypothetical protein